MLKACEAGVLKATVGSVPKGAKRRADKLA